MENLKHTPILKLYNQWMEKGEITNDPYMSWTPNGLCYSPLATFEMFALFTPDHASGYWGHNGMEVRDHELSSYQQEREFTPLRQTIVLFCAAINNEL
jgi:hypothetical protein